MFQIYKFIFIFSNIIYNLIIIYSYLTLFSNFCDHYGTRKLIFKNFINELNLFLIYLKTFILATKKYAPKNDADNR